MKRSRPTIAMLLAAALTFTTVCPALAAEGGVEAGNAQTAPAATEELLTDEMEMTEDPAYGAGMDAVPDQDDASEADNVESGYTEEAPAAEEAVEEADPAGVQETEEVPAAEETVDEVDPAGVQETEETPAADAAVEGEENLDAASGVGTDEVPGQEEELLEEDTVSEKGLEAQNDILSGNSYNSIDNAGEITLETPVHVVVTEESPYAYLKFTPQESCTYEFYSMSDGIDTYGAIIDENGEEIEYDYDGGYEDNFKIWVLLEASKTYYLQTSECNESDAEFDVYVRVFPGNENDSIDNAGEITLETPVHVVVTEESPYAYLKFTPQESCTYEFYSMSDGIDTYGELMSDNVDEGAIAFDDDGGDDSNFKLQLWLEASKTYYIRTYERYKSDAEFDVYVEKKYITVDESGEYGEGVFWSLTGPVKDLTLTISGNGRMDDALGWTDADDIPWYSRHEDIRHLIIEEGIQYIGKDAFYSTNISSVDIPDTVTEIGDEAFFACYNLKDVDIPDSVKRIGDGAFEWCDIDSIEIPYGVESIGSNAFWDCKMEEVYLPESITEIGGAAFRGIVPLRKIVLPSQLTEIEEYVFCECENLTEIVIPDGVKTIGVNAFRLCSSLTRIVIPEGVTNIGNYCFGDCSSLTEIVIPESITDIGEFCFTDCSGLTEIKIPDGVKNIERGTFSGCTGLKSVEIPASVQSFESAGEGVFDRCDNLRDIYYKGTRADWDSISGNDFLSDLPNVTLHTTGDIYAEKIALNKTSATIIKGKSLQLKATVTPSNATNGKVTWKSANTKVATVSGKGLVTAVSAGKTTITAYTGDGKLTAKCSVNVVIPYTIKFNKNATKATLSTTSKKVNSGSAIGSLPTPKYSGYYFQGWYTAKTGGTKVSTSTKPSKSMTLYARWVKRISISKAIVKVASCVYNGKAQSPAVTVTLGKTTLKKDTDFTVAYSGSRTNANGKAYVTITGKNRYSGNVKKQFTVKPRSITSSGVSLKLKETSFNYDGKAKRPGCAAAFLSRALEIGKDFKISYSFNIKVGTAQVIVTGIGNFSGSKKLTFKIVAKKTATLTLDPGSNGYFSTGGKKTVKITSNEKIGTIPTPIAKRGYKFIGWYDKNNGGLIVSNKTRFPYSEIKNCTAVAKYEKIVYKVTFNAYAKDKSSFPYTLPSPITFTVDTASKVVLPKLNMIGCTFHGWQNVVKSSDGKTMIKNVTSLAGLTTNVVLYANYEPHMYTIEYQASEGGTVSNTSSTYCAIDQKIKLPKAVFTAPKWQTFDKWQCIESGAVYKDEETINRPTTNNGEVLHFKALWREITWEERMAQFISLDSYKDGATWGTNNRPLISNADCGWCRAYAADFVAYVYGFKDKKTDEARGNYDSYANDNGGWKYDITEICAGDVVCDQSNNNHVFVVLDIDWETGKMRTAEGNVGNSSDAVVRIGNYYRVVKDSDGGYHLEELYGTKWKRQQFNFTRHYGNVD